MTKITNLDWLTDDTFVCSDQHFGHKNITEFEPCRVTAMKLAGFEDHTEWLVYEHNSVVGKDDTVLFVGDLAFKGVSEVIPRLNGKKYLIMGNHDKKGSQVYNMMDGIISGELLIQREGNDMLKYEESNDPLFSGVIKRINGVKTMFCHYALFNNDNWDRANKMIRPRIDKLQGFYDSFGCDKNVHGHLHSQHSIFEGSINVSLEHIDFKPKRLSELMENM